MAKILMKGCEAIGEAAVRAGCRNFFGYPITPQTEVPEYLAKRFPEVGGLFVQAHVECFDRQRAARGHRVACVDRKVEQHLLELARVRLHVA